VISVSGLEEIVDGEKRVEAARDGLRNFSEARERPRRRHRGAEVVLRTNQRHRSRLPGGLPPNPNTCADEICRPPILMRRQLHRAPNRREIQSLLNLRRNPHPLELGSPQTRS